MSQEDGPPAHQDDHSGPATGDPGQPNGHAVQPDDVPRVTEPHEVTVLLRAAAEGDPLALDRLFEAVYGELKRLAQSHRRKWSGDYTLNTTALVHEAYLKLVRQSEVSWADRGHFYAVASRAMRQILVTYAERRRAAKRGGGAEPLSLDEVNPVAPDAAEEILALDEALRRLAALEERQSRVVECRFFAGMPVKETAEVLGLSPATVKRDWALASAWLRREISVTLERVPSP
jgi:RNA polymerase sigma factor (TIGR02999 family)